MKFINVMAGLLLSHQLWASDLNDPFTDDGKRTQTYQAINNLKEEIRTDILWGATQIGTAAGLSWLYFGVYNPLAAMQAPNMPPAPERFETLSTLAEESMYYNQKIDLIEMNLENRENLYPMVAIASLGIHGFWNVSKGLFKCGKIVYSSTSTCLNEARFLKQD